MEKVSTRAFTWLKAPISSLVTSRGLLCDCEIFGNLRLTFVSSSSGWALLGCITVGCTSAISGYWSISGDYPHSTARARQRRLRLMLATINTFSRHISQLAAARAESTRTPPRCSTLLGSAASSHLQYPDPVTGPLVSFVSSFARQTRTNRSTFGFIV